MINLNSLSLTEGFEQVFSKILSGKPDSFGLQIGAFDGHSFDEIQPIIKKLNIPFLFVEPIDYYFNIMKANLSYSEKNKFDNCAVSNSDGVTLMGVYDPTQFYENKPMSAEFCLTGMSSMFPIKNSPHIPPTHAAEVKTKTLDTLLLDNSMSSFDVFICDTEGYDFEVFKQISDDMFDVCDFWKLEIQHLVKEETDVIVDKFKSKGFMVYTYHDKYEVYTDEWTAYANHKCHDLTAIRAEVLV